MSNVKVGVVINIVKIAKITRNLRNERGNSWDVTTIKVNTNYLVHSFDRNLYKYSDYAML